MCIFGPWCFIIFTLQYRSAHHRLHDVARQCKRIVPENLGRHHGRILNHHLIVSSEACDVSDKDLPLSLFWSFFVSSLSMTPSARGSEQRVLSTWCKGAITSEAHHERDLLSRPCLQEAFKECFLSCPVICFQVYFAFTKPGAKPHAWKLCSAWVQTCTIQMATSQSGN